MNRSTIQKKHMQVIVPGVIALLLPVAFGIAGHTYPILVLCFAILYMIAVSGLDVVFGYCGQISMGHAAFFAIGSYGSALLHKHFELPVLLTMIIASIIAALVGALIAYPASKLVFHFLSLATIAFAEIVHTVLIQSPGNITGNAVGMFTSGVSVLGFPLNSYTRFYYFGLVCLALFLLVKYLLVNSKVGRAFIAIRENTHAAGGMGINVTKYKVTAFAVSAFYTGFAGAMYAHLVKYIGPDTFTMKQSVMFVTMMLFGGTGSLAGPVCGALVVLMLNESLRAFEQYQMLIYGILLLIVIVALPGGIFGAIRSAVLKLLSKGGKKDAA